MWKYLVALVVLLSIGVSGAQIEFCDTCYANVITQEDKQTINTVRIGLAATDADMEENVAVGNEGLSAAIIVTPAYSEGTATFKTAAFARIDQKMDQTISNLGDPLGEGEGAKGVTWNKAIQAAWVANQGIKERETDDEGEPVWAKEGAYISQSTTQLTDNVYDYDSREGAKVLNLDNKLAMIVDDLTTLIDLTATATSTTTDTQSSTGNINNEVDVGVNAQTTGY